jgi:hypothetical protein
MVRPIEKYPNHLSLEDVALPDDHDVLTDVDVNILLIVGDPQGILDQQLGPCPMH